MSSCNLYYTCSLRPVGAAAATDGDRQVVPEKAYRDPGASAAGVKPGHTGEEINRHKHIHVMFLPSSLSTDI